MKLSQKINYIILPVISTIFVIAGAISYYAQKEIVLESLTNKLEYHADYIVRSLENDLHELDSLSKQFINNSEVARYLNGDDSEFETYSAERQLIRFIGNIATANNQSVQLEITDGESNSIFFYNSQNPFAEYSGDPSLKQHLTLFKSQLSDEHSSTVNPVHYQLSPISENLIRLSVYRTFSPEQSIYDNVFSLNSRIFTAKLSTIVDINQVYAATIESNFGESAIFIIKPSDNLISSAASQRIEFTMNSAMTQMQAASPYASVLIQLGKDQINTLLSPYIIAIISLVLNVTFICFYLLKRLIKKQVLHPIENLTSQVAKAIDGDESALSKLESDDEVSSLNNNYIRLLEDLNSLARRDSLTGLANRSVFSSALVRSINDAIHNSKRCALFFIDLDNFKEVNDVYGHHIGDMLLIEFSKILADCFRQSDIIVKPNLYSDIARIAGDEFAVILPNAPGVESISNIAQRLINSCQSGIDTENIHHDIQISIGIAVAPNDALDADSLMRQADAAMYEVKRTGKNGYHFYSASMEDELKRIKWLVENLREALNNDQFHLAFMPVYRCDNREISGVEVLIRSTNPVLQATSPDEYIPVAETNGMIRWIDLWVINNAFEHLKRLIEQHDFTGVMAINISSWELKNPQFAQDVKKLIDKHNVPVSQIELEITETCLVGNNKEIITRLQEIKALGVKLALDDFGTGYTAFSQLQNYPVDTLKIDRSFVNALSQHTGQQRPLVDIVIELASLYDLDVIAEGIETEQQFDYVAQRGCQSAQGYLLSKPLGWDEFVVLLSKDNTQQS